MILKTSDGRSWIEHKFMRIEGRWKLVRIMPKLRYDTGDFTGIQRPEGHSIAFMRWAFTIYNLSDLIICWVDHNRLKATARARKSLNFLMMVN